MVGPRLQIDVSLRLDALSVGGRLASDSDRVAIVGASGAGKSTLLRAIGGLEPAATGRIVVGGVVWLDSARQHRMPAWQRRVGWVPQDPLLFPHLTVAENLAFSGRAPQELESVAELLEIRPLLARWPRHLSGGERQRVAIGRALLSAPRLLLLDEPFAALDRPLRQRLSAAVEARCQLHQVPLILVSHDSEDVQRLADERWLLEEGVLKRDPPP